MTEIIEIVEFKLAQCKALGLVANLNVVGRFSVRVLCLFLISCALCFSVVPEQKELVQKYQAVESTLVTQKVLSPAERHNLFVKTSTHPVANLDALEKYDPSGEIGFCFGRAMTAHLLAKKMGLDSASIRKLFIIGDLRSGDDPEWRFHVTTAVLGEDNQWYAIDPIMLPPMAPGTAISIERWMQIVQSVWDKNQKAHFYWVNPDSIVPDIRTVPAPEKETGERIIELIFDPSKQEGFTKIEFGKGPAYEVSEERQNELFLRVTDSSRDSFPFLKLTINETAEYDFKGYFVDLLADLTASRKVVRFFAAPAEALSSDYSFRRPRSNGLGSFDFSRFQ